MKPGTLYVCATPIGNLEDITLRALRILKEVDLIAAEDTRHTRKLTAYYGIEKPLVSYHEHNRFQRGTELIARLQEGLSIALVTDAGTPGISDPGYDLIQSALATGIPIVPLPGPSAFVTGLIVSGLVTRRFVFEGFLPQKKKEREIVLTQLKTETRTIVLYEAPHRIGRTLKELQEFLGGDRRAALARELTKMHEEVLRGTLEQLLNQVQTRELKGEITLIVEGTSAVREAEASPPSKDTLRQAFEVHIASGLSRQQALKAVAKAYGLRRAEVYKMLID